MACNMVQQNCFGVCGEVGQARQMVCCSIVVLATSNSKRHSAERMQLNQLVAWQWYELLEE
jgi:hypothetical protein